MRLRVRSIFPLGPKPNISSVENPSGVINTRQAARSELFIIDHANCSNKCCFFHTWTGVSEVLQLVVLDAFGNGA